MDRLPDCAMNRASIIQPEPPSPLPKLATAGADRLCATTRAPSLPTGADGEPPPAAGYAVAGKVRVKSRRARPRVSPVLSDRTVDGTTVVRLAGLEPAAFGFVDQRSVQLSYRRTLAEKEGFEPSIGAFTPTLA